MVNYTIFNFHKIELKKKNLCFVFFFSLAITKIDVLDDFDEIKVAVDYKIDGKVLDSFPSIFIFASFGPQLLFN